MSASKEGQRVPQVTFSVYNQEAWMQVSSQQLFQDKTVIVFSLPGAFTPTCSASHLPRYNQLFETFQQHGVDAILCVSVNDTFVMNAWKQSQEADNIEFIPDGNGEFTQAMGMLVNKDKLGFGQRSRRYSMLVKDGVIEKMFIEADQPGDPFEVSDADTMLGYVAPNHQTQEAITLLTKPDCPFCIKAKQTLSDHQLEYEEVVVGKDITSITLHALSGRSSVPQIFIGGQHVGGSDELDALLNHD